MGRIALALFLWGFVTFPGDAAPAPVAGAGQDRDDPPAEKQDPESEKDEAEPVPIEDAEARKILAEERRALAASEPRLRQEAFQRIAGFQNEEIAKELIDGLKDKDQGVVATAIQGLGNQPFKRSQDALLKLLRHPKYADVERHVIETLRSLGKVGWRKSGYEMLRDRFDDAPKEIKREIIRAFVAQKELNAFSLLVDNMDAPAPENPNSPSNPPASYWKKKWEEWSYFKADVRQGLTILTGQSFAAREAAVEWAETAEAHKLGVQYKRGS